MKAITMGVLRSNRFSRLLAGWTVAILLCLFAVPQDAGAAVLQQVQSGTAVNTANGIQTMTISSIDITKSFLVFQVRSTGDRPVSTTLRGRLASSTTIQFERATNEGAPLAINIQWYVATFGSGVLVQRGDGNDVGADSQRGGHGRCLDEPGVRVVVDDAEPDRARERQR